MKKLSFLAAVAIAAGFASCSAPSPKANLETQVDTLSYAIGMAGTRGFDQYLSQQGIDSAHIADFIKGFNKGASMSTEDLAYVLGMQVGFTVGNQWTEGYSRQIFSNDSTQSLNREDLLAGFVDGVVGREHIMSVMKADIYRNAQMEAVREKALAERFADNKAAGEKFLAENKGKEGVQTTPSGLQYKIIKQGNGAIPADTSRVLVNYKGTLIDGTEFDSSAKHSGKDGQAKPAEFVANRVIKGWTEALTMMPVGSKWELYIPYDLAYGSRQTGKIKPFSALVFEVELLGISED